MVLVGGGMFVLSLRSGLVFDVCCCCVWGWGGVMVILFLDKRGAVHLANELQCQLCA